MFREFSKEECTKQFSSTFNGEARVYEFLDKNKTKVILGLDDNEAFVITANKVGTNSHETFYSVLDATERANQLVDILHRLLGTGPGYLSLQRTYIKE